MAKQPPRPKLLCEDPAFDEEELIGIAAGVLGREVDNLTAIYEHGQWWIEDADTGAQWSVCDTSGPDVFCFEQVTQGEED